MKKNLDQLTFNELKMLRDMFSWYNKQPKVLRKEIIAKIEQKMKLKGVQNNVETEVYCRI